MLRDLCRSVNNEFNLQLALCHKSMRLVAMNIRGDRIRERRKQLGLSQDDLAARIGTDQKQISNYENGKGNPTADSLIGLAQTLETSTDYLLGLTDDPTPNSKVNERTTFEEKVLAALRRGDRMEAISIISSGH